MQSQEKYIELINEFNIEVEKLKNSSSIPKAGIKRYIEEMNIHFSHNSTAIEGNKYTYDETRLLLKEGITAANKKVSDAFQIIGNSKAFNTIYDLVQTSHMIHLTEDIIKKIHSQVMIGQESEEHEYRIVDVYIGNEIEANYAAPKFEDVPELMKQYASMVNADLQNIGHIKNNNINPLVLFQMLGKHHVDFERIHPFIDGNGRTGRLLLNFELILIGLIPINIKYEDRARYYAAFSNFEQKERYSNRLESRYERMTKLICECEAKSIMDWNNMFRAYIDSP